MRHFPNLVCTPVAFDNPGPSTHWFPPSSNDCYVCARCYCSLWLWSGRAHVLVSPLRSVWAPPPTNPFLCDNCYWEKVRAKRELYPWLSLLKCLCVRRENLHMFFINRRFYNEAACVFWTENMFACENLTIMGDFLESIRPQTRELIKVSVVADPDGGSEEPLMLRDVPRGMYWLRRCPGLTELELDECFLEKLSWALKVKNVMPKIRVRFIRYEELSRGAFLGDQCPPVWKICIVGRTPWILWRRHWRLVWRDRDC